MKYTTIRHILLLLAIIIITKDSRRKVKASNIATVCQAIVTHSAGFVQIAYQKSIANALHGDISGDIARRVFLD